MEDRGLTLKGEITMMKAMKNFMDKPITYGGYAKMCIGAFAISVAYVVYIYHKLGLFKQWFGKEEVEQEEYEI